VKRVSAEERCFASAGRGDTPPQKWELYRSARYLYTERRLRRPMRRRALPPPYKSTFRIAGGVVRSRTLHTYLGNASNLQPYALESGIPGSAYAAPRDGKESESDAVALETGVTQGQVKSLWGARTCNSETCFDLNVCQTSATLSENANTIGSGDIRLYDQYSNLTERYEFDYGAAPAQGLTCPAPAPTLLSCQRFSGYKRCTHQEFSAGYDQPSTNSNLTLGLVTSNNHIRNLPTTLSVGSAVRIRLVVRGQPNQAPFHMPI
jgi:hypothetical protein